MKKIIVFILIVIGLYGNNIDYNLKYLLESPEVAMNLLIEPIKGEKDWISLALIGTSASLLYTFDEDIRDFVSKNNSKFLDITFNNSRRLGEGLPTGALFLYGIAKGDQGAIDTAWMTLESMGLAIGTVYLFKNVFSRARPYTENGSDKWFARDGFKDEFLSFPSGHSASAFAVAGIIAMEYNEKSWVPPLAYSLATLTALSRLYEDYHWASDILIGSAIGYFTAKTVYKYRRDSNMMILPKVEGDSYGFTFIKKI